MIVEIGIMMGAYIFTRMLSMIIGKKDGNESIGVKIFAVITILVTLFIVFDLFMRGTGSLPTNM